MPPKIPAASDFPAKLRVSIVPPPNDDAPTNVLVLLHGLGDKKEAFVSLARQMKLPETACIALDGPKGLLDLDGFHWGDEIMFDSSTGGLDADAGLKGSSKLVQSLITDVLVDKCGYDSRAIMLFGFGQGGMLALYNALSRHIESKPSNTSELAGVISIGAGLSSDAAPSLVNKCKTPILVCAGIDRSSVTPQVEEKLKRNFDHVEIKRYRRPGDAMPTNRDEMMPIMQFFSKRLLSKKGVPDDSIEIR